MESKKPLASKTIWLGILTTLISILGLVGGEAWIQEYPQVVSGIGFVGGVLVLVLRWATTVPLTIAKKK